MAFFEVYMFSQWKFCWSMGLIFWFCYHTYLTKLLRSCPWLVYIWSFHWVMIIHTYFCTKDYDYVKCFFRVFVLLVINTGCPKLLLKMGNTALLISNWNYAKTPYKCVYRRRFVFPIFSNFSETPCMKVDFDVRISPWEITFSFVFQDFTSTCGEQHF